MVLYTCYFCVVPHWLTRKKETQWYLFSSKSWTPYALPASYLGRVVTAAAAVGRKREGRVIAKQDNIPLA